MLLFLLSAGSALYQVTFPSGPTAEKRHDIALNHARSGSNDSSERGSTGHIIPVQRSRADFKHSLPRLVSNGVAPTRRAVIGKVAHLEPLGFSPKVVRRGVRITKLGSTRIHWALQGVTTALGAASRRCGLLRKVWTSGLLGNFARTIAQSELWGVSLLLGFQVMPARRTTRCLENAVRMGGPAARMLISDGRSSSPNGQFDWPGVCGTPVMLTARVPGDRQGIQAPGQDWTSSGWSAGGGGGPLS